MSAADEGTPNVAFQNEAKYPGQTTEFRGPGVSAENPAGAFPRDLRQPDPDPIEAHRPRATIFQSIENPYALQEALTKLESGLDEVISLFQAEKNTLAREGGFTKGKQGIELFESWKQQLERIKAGQE
ncbi:uncharacterized protein PAN0_009d3743 [Moesziomyces antarcticus]|uniref:Uncharacterized protein n=2 Tax=Pseudozyma antarctica TaxID=84753 RepID=A0A081CFT0_PSEA2|nr:uncharacterized protein PAN0_009d3743 [Moesziomyces antarcticus]GAK65526.1 conserved hypothetical protein [Moesziomyces antarcticus]SPO46536.1 uncharacterized protein PSANT_04222 [Moesziomyces antarcticus]